MSALVASFSWLKPGIRLAQAISQFEADLSSEQKTAFSAYRSQSRDFPPGPSDVMRLTAEIDRQTSGRVGRRCFGPRLTNFLQAVQQFAALGDVIVGGSQNIIACGVWSLVQMSLLFIVNFSSYLDKLLTFLMTIDHSAPRYQIMALLYSQSRNMQSYLSEYFIVVVRHQVLKFTKILTIAQFASTLSDFDIKTYQSELDHWANMIKEEASLLISKKIDEEARENFKFRALSSKYSESISRRRKMKTNLRVLDLCSMYDYKTAWKQIRKVGSSTLYNQNAEDDYIETLPVPDRDDRRGFNPINAQKITANSTQPTPTTSSEGCVRPSSHIKEWHARRLGRGEGPAGFTTSCSTSYRTEDRRDWGELEPAPCPAFGIRVTRPEIIHGSTPFSIRRRRTLSPWYSGIHENHEDLEVHDTLSWSELAACHRDLGAPAREPSGRTPRYGLPGFRFPGSIVMESSSALGDALVGRRKWTDSQACKERDILLGDNDERARAYITAVKEKLITKYREAYGHLEEMEKKFFDEHSYFYCQEHSLETDGEDTEGTPTTDDEEGNIGIGEMED